MGDQRGGSDRWTAPCLALIATVLVASFALAHEPAPRAAVPQAFPKPDEPGVRRGHVLVSDPEGGVLLLGGHLAVDAPLNETLWCWDGEDWRPASRGRGLGEGLESRSPGARVLAAGALDRRRSRIVIYGGIGTRTGTRWGDTWEWDGTRWLEYNVAGPGSLDHHAMAYDEARSRTVMYGGQLWDRSFATATWEWDGSAWASHEVSGPGPRAHHAMAYDTDRHQTLLFGGVDSDGRLLQDLWAWDGSAWTLLADGGPEPRARHRMAFDQTRGVLILVGGNGVSEGDRPGFRVLNDVWTWDGRRWSSAGRTPRPRYMHAMAYDTTRDRVVLFGGGDGLEYDDALWEWDGTRWTVRRR